jgi:hypothetical protein
MLDNDPKGDHNKRQVKEKTGKKRGLFQLRISNGLAEHGPWLKQKSKQSTQQHPSQNQYY